MMSNIQLLNEKFESNRKAKTFSRINEWHPVNFFVGYDDNGRATLIVNENGNIKNIKSTQYIEAKITKNPVGKMFVSFILLDSSKQPMFIRFCDDLINSSQNIEKDRVFNFIINRWDSWRNIFKNAKEDLLSENEILGLIGELSFLSNLIDQVGAKKAIESWSGENKSSKDFECEDIWYEIKTKYRGSQDITISSIEQLDSSISGLLVVNVVEKTSPLNNLGFSLNKMVNLIRNKISNYEHMSFLNIKLSKIGYIDQEEYEEFNYKFLKKEIYYVDDKFPRMKEKDLKNGIIGVSYKILLESIKEFNYNGRDYEWILRNISAS